ncbi:MAG: hypothetical protein JWQ49_9 [Edaphobacter sp.]|nr:hypothetical protein [Edaphobacter sp.]
MDWKRYCQPDHWHEAANLFPILHGTEFSSLVLDIKENGLQNPVVAIRKEAEAISHGSGDKPLFEIGYPLAEQMLQPQPYPDTCSLPKLDAQADSAKGLDARFYRPPINATALSVNPSLTISALSERVVFHIVHRREMELGDAHTPSNRCFV